MSEVYVETPRTKPVNIKTTLICRPCNEHGFNG